jgi:pimeloyl-ACP methyl ester carboxylesterase
MNLSDLKSFATSRAGVLTGAAVSAAATAIWVEVQARRAEREHPPTGKFLDIDGVHLHYVERGEGPAVVLIHGNTVSMEDFEASGLIDRLALTHRVIAFDRPGFGHSDRPRDRLWTPSAQGRLFHAALAQLGVGRPVVVGHSMGTLVALAMALDRPAEVRSLVLLGGYYYPSLRVDALLTAPVALPVLGDVMRYTVTAVSGRAMIKGLVKGMFSPNEVPPQFFSVLSREMLLRPVQLRANAEDAAFMIPEATSHSDRYRELRLPVTIIAGDGDKVVDHEAHSKRLHADVPQSELLIVPDAGHMVHYVAPERVVAAVDRAL